MSKGDIKSAEKVLNAISLRNTGKSFLLIDLHSTLLNIDNYSESALNNDNTQLNSKKYLIQRLFQGYLLIATIFLSLVIITKAYFSTSYSYSSIINYMPEFLNEFPTSEAYLMIVTQQICTIPGVLLGAFLIETILGRKYTTIISYILGGIFCYLFYFDNNPIYVRNIIDLFYYWINDPFSFNWILFFLYSYSRIFSY